MVTLQDAYVAERTRDVLSHLGQRFVVLSDSSRQNLLSEAGGRTHGHQSRAQAAYILSRLNELNPSIGSQFRPKEYALSSLALRMICSAPTQESTAAAEESQIPSFIAVSYCWHYPAWPLAPAATPIVPGWEISRPMMDAVMNLRQAPDEGIWLDKLCINQNDEADKMVHIGAMNTIYHSARRIAILLEDIQLDQEEQEAGLAYAAFYADLSREIHELGLEGEEKRSFFQGYFPRRENQYQLDNKGHILAAAKPFAMKLLGARWFSRAWCAHESRTTRHRRTDNPLFLCFGADGRVLSFEFRFIHYLALYLSNSDPPEGLTGTAAREVLNNPYPKTLRQRWFRIQRLLPNTGPDDSAMQHLVNLLSFGCFKKGDLISIALNTAGIPLCYGGGDIQCVEDIIWIFSLLVLASGDLVPLVTTGTKLRTPDAGDGTGTVSWAIDPYHGGLVDRLPAQLPNSITAITRDYIEVDLLVFESGPNPASGDSTGKATYLAASYDLDTQTSSILSTLPTTTQSIINGSISTMSRIKTTTGPLPAVLRGVISLALDNGLEWLLAFPSSISNATSSPSWIYGRIPSTPTPELASQLAPAAQSLLTLFGIPPSEQTAERLQQTTTFLLTAVDPRLILLTPVPRNLPLSPSLGTALLTSSTSNRSYIALPTAVAHLPGCHDRAWVIEPFDPTAPKEKLEDWLPPAGLRISTKEGEAVNKVEDLIPVLSSDYEDRRAAMPTGVGEKGTWRLRRKQLLFGGQENWGLWGNEEGASEIGEGKGVVLLRRQRVYGSEDYAWGEIYSATRKAFGNTEFPETLMEVPERLVDENRVNGEGKS